MAEAWSLQHKNMKGKIKEIPFNSRLLKDIFTRRRIPAVSILSTVRNPYDMSLIFVIINLIRLCFCILFSFIYSTLSV